MVSLAQIQKLSAQLDELEGKRRGKIVAIEIPACMDSDAVWARHFELHPRDKVARTHVAFMRYSAPNLGPVPADAQPAFSAGWRAVAQETVAKIGLAAAMRAWGQRMLADYLQRWRENDGRELRPIECNVTGWCASFVREYGLPEAEVREALIDAGVSFDKPAVVKVWNIYRGSGAWESGIQ